MVPGVVKPPRAELESKGPRWFPFLGFRGVFVLVFANLILLMRKF